MLEANTSIQLEPESIVVTADHQTSSRMECKQSLFGIVMSDTNTCDEMELDIIDHINLHKATSKVYPMGVTHSPT